MGKESVSETAVVIDWLLSEFCEAISQFGTNFMLL